MICLEDKLTSELNLIHFNVGCGLPVASHVKVSDSPSFFVILSPSRILISGADSFTF
jgi:hypothetical protein